MTKNDCTDTRPLKNTIFISANVFSRISKNKDPEILYFPGPGIKLVICRPEFATECGGLTSVKTDHFLSGIVFFPPARLVHGQSHGEGLVQVYANNTWVWVCADQWDKKAADVACSGMMDFEGSTASSLVYENEKKKEGTLWLNNIKCTGEESTLLLCGHHDISVGSQNCKGKQKAGVKCKPKGREISEIIE